MSVHRQHKQEEHPRRDAAVLPPGPFAEAYRIAGYHDGLVAATPASDLLKPHYDSGLKWGGSTPNPEAPCWGRGVAGGVRWDGTFHRDLARYPEGGPLFLGLSTPAPAATIPSPR